MELPPTPSAPQAAAATNTDDDPSSPPKPKKTAVLTPPNPDLTLQGIGEYTFIEPLGNGKFSKVMLAEHYITREQYAVKVKKERMKSKKG